MRQIASESAVEKRAEEVCERANDPDPLPAEPPPPENHGRTIRWRTRGGEMVVTSSGCRSPAHALATAYADAVAQGYRRPRWWQLRRLYEPNYERMLRAATAAVSRQASPPGLATAIARALHERRRGLLFHR